MHENQAWKRKITVAVPFLKPRKNGIYLIMQSDTSEIIVILIGVFEYNHSESVSFCSTEIQLKAV